MFTFPSVFQGVVGFGSPVVDKICLLKLSLLVGVVEFCVCPQRIKEDRSSFGGLVGGVAIACADGHNFLQAPGVKKVSCILVTVLQYIVQCVTGRGCSFNEKVSTRDCVRNYGNQIRKSFFGNFILQRKIPGQVPEQGNGSLFHTGISNVQHLPDVLKSVFLLDNCPSY